MVVRFAEGDAVGFEAGAEAMENASRIESQEAFAVALKKSCLDGVCHTGEVVLVGTHGHTVDEEESLLQLFRLRIRSICGFGGGMVKKKILHADHFSVDVET